MRRAIAGACAACLSTTALYPLDTLRLRAQANSSVAIVAPFSGFKYDLVGSGLASYTYFELYETMRGMNIQIVVSSFLAILMSTAIMVPFRVHQKRTQCEDNEFAEIPRISWETYAMSYRYSIVKNSIRVVLKFFLYEHILDFMVFVASANSNLALLGGLSGAISGLLITTLTLPLDNIKTQNVIGIAPTLKSLLVGWRLTMLQSVVGNMLGGAVLEALGPRKSTFAFP